MASEKSSPKVSAVWWNPLPLLLFASWTPEKSLSFREGCVACQRGSTAKCYWFSGDSWSWRGSAYCLCWISVEKLELVEGRFVAEAEAVAFNKIWSAHELYICRTMSFDNIQNFTVHQTASPDFTILFARFSPWHHAQGLWQSCREGIHSAAAEETCFVRRGLSWCQESQFGYQGQFHSSLDFSPLHARHLLTKSGSDGKKIGPQIWSQMSPTKTTEVRVNTERIFVLLRWIQARTQPFSFITNLRGTVRRLSGRDWSHTAAEKVRWYFRGTE